MAPTGSRSSYFLWFSTSSSTAETSPWQSPRSPPGRGTWRAWTSKAGRSTWSTGAGRSSNRVLRQRSDPGALLALRDVFGDLSDQPQFVAAYRAALAALHERGARASTRSAARGPASDGLRRTRERMHACVAAKSVSAETFFRNRNKAQDRPGTQRPHAAARVTSSGRSGLEISEPAQPRADCRARLANGSVSGEEQILQAHAVSCGEPLQGDVQVVV